MLLLKWKEKSDLLKEQYKKLRKQYFWNEKKFIAEGAGQQLLEEAQALEENADLIRQIHEARTELADTYLKLKRLSQACGQSAHTDSSEPPQHS